MCSSPGGARGSSGPVVDNATVPVIETGTGICHVYVDRAADLDMAAGHPGERQVQPAHRCATPPRCCLVHREAAPVFLPRMRERLTDARAARGERPVELRLDRDGGRDHPRHARGSGGLRHRVLATTSWPSGWWTALEEAIDHIAAHSTGHSEAIVTEDGEAARRFLAAVDAAAVYCQRLHPLHRRRGVRPGLRRWASPPRSSTPGAPWGWPSCAASSS